jgi:hypothetical protein
MKINTLSILGALFLERLPEGDGPSQPAASPNIATARVLRPMPVHWPLRPVPNPIISMPSLSPCPLPPGLQTPHSWHLSRPIAVPRAHPAQLPTELQGALLAHAPEGLDHGPTPEQELSDCDGLRPRRRRLVDPPKLSNASQLDREKHLKSHRNLAACFKQLKATYPEIWAQTPYEKGRNSFNLRKKHFIQRLPSNAAVVAGVMPPGKLSIRMFCRTFVCSVASYPNYQFNKS